MVKALQDKSLRSASILIGSEEQRHAAALAGAINPDVIIGPVVLGGIDEPDADGFPIPYAIPSTFGQLTGISLVVGDVDAEGSRFSVQLQTPADNTFVYDSMSC